MDIQNDQNNTVMNPNFVKYKKKVAKSIVWKTPSFIKLVLSMFVLSIIFTLGIQIIRHLQEVELLEQEMAVVLESKKQMEEQKILLKQQVDLLHDNEYIAKLARSEYFLSKPGDIIFYLPQLPKQNSEGNQ